MLKGEARDFVRWFTQPDRVRRFHEITAAAWKAKRETPETLSSPAGDEHAAKAARQFLCSMIDQYEAEVFRGQSAASV